jgi:hypothetical protein
VEIPLADAYARDAWSRPQPAGPGALGGAVLVVAVTVGSVVLALLPAVLRVDAAKTLRNE